MKLWKPKSLGSRITAGLTLVSVIVGIVLGIRQLIPDPKPPHLSVVFILDVSNAMYQPFGKTKQTKLSSAQQTILTRLLPLLSGASTSLRLVTAGCEGENTPPPPTIDFAKNNAARYRELFDKLPGQRPSGGVEGLTESSFLTGLTSAANDLKSKNLIAESKEKLLVVLMADERKTCGSPLTFRTIGSGLSVQFFWLGTAPGGLKEIREQLENFGFTVDDARKVRSPKQLTRVITRIVPRYERDTAATTGTTLAETETMETEPDGGAVGDAATGEQIFAERGCGSCHVLEEAGSSGTVGPNLDESQPSHDLIVERVTNGAGPMPAFKDTLSEQQIQDVAAFVFESTH